MAQFPSDAQGLDPYKNFKLRVWDGHSVHFGGKLTGLVPPEVAKYREGGGLSVQKSPGRTKYDPVTIERGVTHDPAFEQWANKVWNFGAGAGSEVSLADFRKDITIDFFNEAGQKALSYNLYRCWVSEYQALPDLDANADAVAIEHIKLENEGWERDTSVTEPKEPTSD